jgi:hypothetical protein
MGVIITTIKNGLPCQARITHISGEFVPARVDADPDDCHEAEWPEIEWELLTARGRRGKWLANVASAEDLQRIENELWESLK